MKSENDQLIEALESQNLGIFEYNTEKIKHIGKIKTQTENVIKNILLCLEENDSETAKKDCVFLLKYITNEFNSKNFPKVEAYKLSTINNNTIQNNSQEKLEKNNIISDNKLNIVRPLISDISSISSITPLNEDLSFENNYMIGKQQNINMYIKKNNSNKLLNSENEKNMKFTNVNSSKHIESENKSDNFDYKIPNNVGKFINIKSEFDTGKVFEKYKFKQLNNETNINLDENKYNYTQNSNFNENQIKYNFNPNNNDYMQFINTNNKEGNKSSNENKIETKNNSSSNISNYINKFLSSNK